MQKHDIELQTLELALYGFAGCAVALFLCWAWAAAANAMFGS